MILFRCPLIEKRLDSSVLVTDESLCVVLLTFITVRMEIFLVYWMKIDKQVCPVTREGIHHVDLWMRFTSRLWAVALAMGKEMDVFMFSTNWHYKR